MILSFLLTLSSVLPHLLLYALVPLLLLPCFLASFSLLRFFEFLFLSFIFISLSFSLTPPSFLFPAASSVVFDVLVFLPFLLLRCSPSPLLFLLLFC